MGWDSAVEMYSQWLMPNHRPYAELATKMIALINQLKLDAEFGQVNANTGAMTLMLSLPRIRGIIDIDWDFKTRLYTIGINLHEKTYAVESEDVTEEEIIEKLREYVKRLKAEGTRV